MSTEEFRTCRVCQVPKSASDCLTKKNLCKQCKKEIDAQYYKDHIEQRKVAAKIWSTNNKDKRKEHRKKWIQNNKQKSDEYKKEWKEKNKDRLNLHRRLWRRNVSHEEFDQLILKAGGKCAICKEETKLDIDHDHKTGKIRELLCSKCNKALGLFRDNPTILRAAASYLEKHFDNPGLLA